MSAGNGENEVDQHAAVQWQIADRLGLDDFADAGIGGVEDFRHTLYLSRLLNRADFERNCDGQALAHFET